MYILHGLRPNLILQFSLPCVSSCDVNWNDSPLILPLINNLIYVFFRFFTAIPKKKKQQQQQQKIQQKKQKQKQKQNKSKNENEKEKENSKDFDYIETTHLSRDDHRGMLTFWRAYL